MNGIIEPGVIKMALEAGIVFDYINEIHYTKVPEDLNLKVSDQLIVKTVRSKEVGKVAHLREAGGSTASNPFLKKILRLATTRDLEREEQNRSREEKAMSIATKKIDHLKLNMTLIRVHYLFDHSRILFYFKAAGKVDFRNLVRELASVFKARIELRQIGVRDEAKMLGGIATCGRPLCCSSWLRAFAPVTVRMAKEQHLSLNPTKISGLCGRLQCCLEYEQEFYETTQKKLPNEGSMVNTSKGRGRLVKANILTSKAIIVLSDNSSVTVHIDELSGKNKHGCHSNNSCGGNCHSKTDTKGSHSKDAPRVGRQSANPSRKSLGKPSEKTNDESKPSRNKRFNRKKRPNRNDGNRPQQNTGDKNNADKSENLVNKDKPVNQEKSANKDKPRSRRNRNRSRNRNNDSNASPTKSDNNKPSNNNAKSSPPKPSANEKKPGEKG